MNEAESTQPNPTAEPPAADKILVPETLLCEQLNVPIKKLRDLRPSTIEKTADGIGWPLADAQALADQMKATLTLPDKKTAPELDGELVTVFSTAKGSDGRHFANPNVIQCKRSNGQVVVVRVVNSAKYRPTLRISGEPMTLRAKQAVGGNWWVLVGREPRFTAQW